LRGMPVGLRITRADGSVEQHYPADPIPRWIGLAVNDQVAARALRIRARGPLDWDGSDASGRSDPVGGRYPR
jgi:hypothetical protein